MRKILKIFIIIFIILIIGIIITLYKLNDTTSVKENVIVENVSKPIINNNTQNTNSNISVNNNLAKFEVLKERNTYIELEDIAIKLISDMRLVNSEAAIKYEYKIESQELINKKKQEIKESIEDRISSKCNLENTINDESFKNIIMKDAYTINKIYKKEINSKINAFIIYGEFSKNNTEYMLMVIYDNNSSVYEIYLEEYLKKTYNLDDINSIDININNIEKNANNKIVKYTKQEAEEQFAKRYLLATKAKLKSKPEEIYNKLDNSYRKKYENLEDFINRSKKMQISQLKQYKVVEKENYSDIICRDKLGNCILFRESYMMNYKIVLDPYTIDVDTLISEYDSTDHERMLLNIEKIAQMINMGDYDVLYKELNETFRNNNFITLEEFEKYIKENFYERTRIVYKSSKKEEGGYFSIKVTVINEEKIEQRKSGEMVMKVYNGDDFEVSFSV